MILGRKIENDGNMRYHCNWCGGFFSEVTEIHSEVTPSICDNATYMCHTCKETIKKLLAEL